MQLQPRAFLHVTALSIDEVLYFVSHRDAVMVDAIRSDNSGSRRRGLEDRGVHSLVTSTRCCSSIAMSLRSFALCHPLSRTLGWTASERAHSVARAQLIRSDPTSSSTALVTDGTPPTFVKLAQLIFVDLLSSCVANVGPGKAGRFRLRSSGRLLRRTFSNASKDSSSESQPI